MAKCEICAPLYKPREISQLMKNGQVRDLHQYNIYAQYFLTNFTFH